MRRPGLEASSSEQPQSQRQSQRASSTASAAAKRASHRMDSASSGTLMSERASIGSRDPSMYTISPVTSPARGRAPAGQAPGLPAPGPRAACRGEQDPPQGALGRVPRSSRDASGLAPVTRRAEVDEAVSPARAPRDRSGGLQADPSDGEGEPSVGIPCLLYTSDAADDLTRV